MNYIQYKVDIPPGEKGKWKIENFEITTAEADSYNLRERCNNRGLGYRGVEAGKYTRICIANLFNDVIMSDTPVEIADHIEAIEKARGQVLITGLGIGVILNACLNKPEVEHCTVIEIEPDVIALVAPHYQKKWGDRLTIVNEDAFKYRPQKGIKYDMIWHDIWSNICTDNYKEIKTLKAKYRPFKKVGGWQGCWVENEIKRLNRVGY